MPSLGSVPRPFPGNALKGGSERRVEHRGSLSRGAPGGEQDSSAGESEICPRGRAPALEKGPRTPHPYV